MVPRRLPTPQWRKLKLKLCIGPTTELDVPRKRLISLSYTLQVLPFSLTLNFVLIMVRFQELQQETLLKQTGLEESLGEVKKLWSAALRVTLGQSERY